MREIETSAKTVEEAIEQGLQSLGVSIGDVDVQVVEEGSKGLFGLFGSRMAKVKLTVKEDDEDPLGDLVLEERAEDRKTESAAKAQPAKAEELKTEAPKAEPTLREPAAEIEEKPASKARPAAPLAEPVRREAKKSNRKSSKERKPAVEEKEDRTGTGADAPDSDVSTESAAPAEMVHMEKPEVHVIPADQVDPESAAGRTLAFLREITKLMGVEVDIEMGTDDEGNVYASMTGDTLGILIGRRGETLDALQYLTSVRVNRGQETYTRVTLDTENYRAKREDTLIRLANRMANRALRTGRRVRLEPMNPYERRIIHYALQKNESVDTHSEGDEPNRHVVITLKK